MFHHQMKHQKRVENTTRSGVFLTNFVLGCQLTVSFQYGEYGLWYFGVVLSWLKLVPLLQKDRKMAKHANLAATWS